MLQISLTPIMLSQAITSTKFIQFHRFALAPFVRCASSTSSSSDRIGNSKDRARSSTTTGFHPPPNSPAGFLAELKSFAERTPLRVGETLATHLPLSFSGDADLILAGKRRVVDRSSKFNFKCTGCGACCATYPKDVMLDPHDLYLMSRSTGLWPIRKSFIDVPMVSPFGIGASTVILWQEYPKAFQSQLGLFESNPYLIKDSTSSSLASHHKLAPVLFLQTKKVKQISKQTGATAINERCWFSYPSEKIEVEFEPATSTDPSNTAAGQIHTVQPPSRSGTTTPTTKTGLRCRLGPAGQPTSCALYPLGELYPPETIPNLSTRFKPATMSSPYYSLDITNCEGTHVASTPTTHMKVDEYVYRNDLVDRREEWEWFEREIAQPFAKNGWLSLDASPLPTTLRDELRETLARVWYNFDTLSIDTAAVYMHDRDPVSVDPLPTRFPDWPSARHAITITTTRVIKLTETYLTQAIKNQREAQLEWQKRIHNLPKF